MITRPTTLILGAGASVPFGFPTGYKLLQEVLEITNENTFPSKIEFFVSTGFSPDDIRHFRNMLFKSNKSSVDSFLEHRPEFIDIGKTAMAIALLKYEDETKLFQRTGNSWYEYLFSELNTRFEDFDKNTLSILTFNYDRSLEHCLLTALIHSYGKKVTDCESKLHSIPIVHLHGDLGALGGVVDDNASQRPYSTDTAARTIRIAASRIKIIHEGFDNAPQFELAQDILSKSEVICFLGFGFHPLNMKRLGFNPSSKARDYTARIFGTSLGLTNTECNRISYQYRIPLRDANFSYETLDVLKFLREKGILYLE